MIDILILSNGPGEVATWVRPVVRSLRELGVPNMRISVVLSPCPNATGKEAAIVQTYQGVDRVQASAHFWQFLLWGKTVDNWDWSDRGVVLFLGGDQFFTVAIAKRLGYHTVVYAEWAARWHNLVDRFAVMKPDILKRVSPKFAHKFTVVGDLMAEVQADAGSGEEWSHELIGVLPGSKVAKLAQGVPLTLAIAEHVHAARPETKFVIPVAPTLDLQTLARFADPAQNPVAQHFGFKGAELILSGQSPIETEDTASLKLPVLKTTTGLCVDLWTQAPAYDLLSRCSLCLTTVGANTAELGALSVPMIVLLPTQQLDAMRAWGGIPGILANMPLLGSSMAKAINWIVIQRAGLLAWPNIWAQEMVVPELVGLLQPSVVAEMVLDFLAHPEKLATMRTKLRGIRGNPGAAQKIAAIVAEVINEE